MRVWPCSATPGKPDLTAGLGRGCLDSAVSASVATGRNDARAFADQSTANHRRRRGAAARTGATGLGPGRAAESGLRPHHRADFAEIAPGQIIKTFGYNGTVPGPLIRVREGQNVTIDIANNSDHDEIVHWHGLVVPSPADGAMEEGAP